MPEKVTVYARKDMLDSIKYVTTADLNSVTYNDTVELGVELKQVKVG